MSDPAGAANASITTALNAVRHRIRDGVPTNDSTPVYFNIVRLESLTDQIQAVPTPVQKVFQVRFQDIPTQRLLNANVVPGTLVAYVDGSWVATQPTIDVDQNGNFTLPLAPVSALLITYAWQYMADGEIKQFIDEARQWLREFQTVSNIPDGLVPALISNASARALGAMANTTARLTLVKAGDEEVDWSKLSAQYQAEADAAYKQADHERELYYTSGPEALDPSAVVVTAPNMSPYTPER